MCMHLISKTGACTYIQTQINILRKRPALIFDQEMTLIKIFDIKNQICKTYVFCNENYSMYDQARSIRMERSWYNLIHTSS